MSTTPDSTFVDPQELIADLQRQLAATNAERDEALAERDEALAQQAATTEVVQVINSSPGDLAPVFEAILEKAHALCGIAMGELELYEDGKVRAVAMRGVSGLFADLLREPFAPPPGSPPAQLIAGESTVQITDVSELARNRPDDARARAGAEHGLRTALFVPLRKDNALLGYITGYRRETRPFSKKEIVLLQNFAAQAVIAIENTCLITETREALEQQTATAEVLQVINSSPGDLAPVFDAMLERAVHLCEAAYGALWNYDGEHLHITAVHSAPPEFEKFLRKGPHLPSRLQERLLSGEPFAHIADLEAHPVHNPLVRASIELGGIRTFLAVPLRKDDRGVGIFGVYRQEVRPFSDKQIALLQNFAAQAVIAMENARLLTETREALEQQTATTEVLQVINSSPGDLTPVFDAMLNKASRLCEAAFGNLYTFDGERFHLAACHGDPDYIEWLWGTTPVQPETAITLQRIALGAAFVNIGDVLEDTGYREAPPESRTAADTASIRSLLTVALRKDDLLLGSISVYRREVRPFSDKQIALLQNFAAQAVIAIENARLITETREALEQQTATAEVLQVINASPGDLAPVFNEMLEKATRLCEAAFGFMDTYKGGVWETVALREVPSAYAKYLTEPRRAGPGTAHARIEGEKTSYISLMLPRRNSIELGIRNGRAWWNLPARGHFR